jgi:hypothetical protein
MFHVFWVIASRSELLHRSIAWLVNYFAFQSNMHRNAQR